MKSCFLMILLGLVIILFQTWLFPSFVPFRLKPDLFLILVVYLGIYAGFYRGVLFSLLFGLFQDVFAGNSMGLYGLVFALIFLLVRYAASRFNAEALGTFYYLLVFSTFATAALTCFFQLFFTDSGLLWYVVAQNFIPQVLLNILFAFLLLRLLLLLQRTTERALPIPGRSSHDDF